MSIGVLKRNENNNNQTCHEEVLQRGREGFRQSCSRLGGPTLLALLGLWEEELGRRWERVAGHQHQLLELQQLLDVLIKDNGQSKQGG